MKISVTYRNYDGESYTRWIDEVVAAGIRYMEIATSALPEQRERQDEITRYALDRGMELSLHAPFGVNNISSTDIERRTSSINNTKMAIDLAERHGLRVVTFHPGRLSFEGQDIDENRALLTEVLADIADYAKQRRVFVGLENMEDRPFEYIRTVKDLNRFAHLSKDNPYFGVTVDFGHYATLKEGLAPIGSLRLPLYDVHLSRFDGARAHRPFSEEDRDELCEIVRALKGYGYDGFLVLEIVGDVFLSVDILRGVLSKVDTEAAL